MKINIILNSEWKLEICLRSIGRAGDLILASYFHVLMLDALFYHVQQAKIGRGVAKSL